MGGENHNSSTGSMMKGQLNANPIRSHSMYLSIYLTNYQSIDGAIDSYLLTDEDIYSYGRVLHEGPLDEERACQKKKKKSVVEEVMVMMESTSSLLLGCVYVMICITQTRS